MEWFIFVQHHRTVTTSGEPGMGCGGHGPDRLQPSENKTPSNEKHGKIHVFEPCGRLYVCVSVLPRLPALSIKATPITPCNLRPGLIDQPVERIPRIPLGPFELPTPVSRHLASIFAADPGPQPHRLAHLVKREPRSSSASILLAVWPRTGPKRISIAGLCVPVLLYYWVVSLLRQPGSRSPSGRPEHSSNPPHRDFEKPTIRNGRPDNSQCQHRPSINRSWPRSRFKRGASLRITSD